LGASGAGEVRGLLVPICRSSAASVRGRADPRPTVERKPPPRVRAAALRQAAQPLLPVPRCPAPLKAGCAAPSVPLLSASRGGDE